jgi:hypothetical protein
MMANRLSKIPYLIQQDNFFTEKECKSLIRKYKKLCTSDSLKTYLNYNYYDIKMNDDWGKKLLEIVNKYIKKYKGLDIIEQWAIDNIRFKHFPKNYSFDKWHCEQTTNYPYRVFSILIYLSDHNVGTEFYHEGKTIKSKAGRAIIFPASWTHIHRGQKTNKDRYMLSCYAFLRKPNEF